MHLVVRMYVYLLLPLLVFRVSSSATSYLQISPQQLCELSVGYHLLAAGRKPCVYVTVNS